MVVAGLLSLISSRADYSAEKLFYQATKVGRKIALNPDVAPPTMLASVERGLKKIVEKYPKAAIAKIAHLSLAEYYLNKEEYAQAESRADEIIAKYTEDRDTLSKAYFIKGSAFEKQDQWNKALKEYQTLRDRYTDTLVGLGMPIYIAEYYKGKQKYDQADLAYQDAINFYRKLERENRAKVLGYAAANLLINSHLALEQYEQAGQVLENTLNNYPKVQVFAQQIPSIEAIFIKKLNKPERALQLYENIRDKIDNKQILEFVDERIKALNVQKNGQ